MPKKFDPAKKERVVRMVLEHAVDTGSVSKACELVGAREGVSKETVRGWVRRATSSGDAGQEDSNSGQVKQLKAKVRSLEEENAILRSAATFFAGELDPPTPMIVDFIDAQREQGHAVESICKVLTDLGAPIAARTYRAAKATRSPSPTAVGLAYLMNEIHSRAFVLGPMTGARRLRPEGLYGRRKMTAPLARADVPASYERVHKAMRALGHEGVRRTKKVRTTVAAPAADRAPDLLKRDFTAAAPNRVWVTDFTYVRTWTGFVYVAFIVDVYAQRILSWHASTSKSTDLVTW